MLAASLLTIIVACQGPETAAPEPDVLAIVGGTILDLTDAGNSADDITDGVVLVEDGYIRAVGTRDEVIPPDGARVIDASGKYILPGLFDGFAALNNQSYANAYLYMGVTSIIAVSGGRRGDLFESSDPGPTIYKLQGVGRRDSPTELVLQQIETLAEEGYRIVLLMYRLTPDQLQAGVEKAHELGLGTIGELGFTSYHEAVSTGIDAFVHTSRYSLDAAPPEMARSVAEQPFSDDLDSPKWRYYKFLTEVDPADPRLLEHASVLGEGDVAIMPTSSIVYLDMDDNTNPWDEPVAGILDPADINNPADAETGRHTYDAEHEEAYRALANKMVVIEDVYYSHGARYLAGSGTDVWGTMPGISLHTELELLTRIGLTPRQAIAAATTNIVEAFGWNDTGRVEEGRVADLLVVAENPLEDLEHLKKIDTLIKGGVVLDRDGLLR
jgi:hypothetical protein